MMLTRNTDQMRAEIARHIAADAVRGGLYWNGESGSFIGCLAHSSDAAELERRYGLPLPLVLICESIFDRLPQSDRPDFFAEVGDAVGEDGRDLSKVHWAFLADTLRRLPDTAARDVVRPVIDGMDRLARGEGWSQSEAQAAEARAGARAAAKWAARAAADEVAAAEDAVKAAEAAEARWAAEAAADETMHQRAALIRIIREIGNNR